MTMKPPGPPVPQDGPYCDIESLIRATHAELGGVAFRCLGNKADAEDAVQTACIKVMRCWAKVRGFATPEQQRAYLVTTVTNEALQIRRRAYRRREVLFAEDAGADPGWMPAFPGGDGQPSDELLRRLWRALSELPDENREVLLLFAAGYEYSEIAEMLDIKTSTVRSHVCSARRRLRRVAPPGWEEGMT
jgi:RNA polymerase sigma-70 factor (ECF subfamily)